MRVRTRIRKIEIKYWHLFSQSNFLNESVSSWFKKTIFTKNYVLFIKSLLNNYTISDKNVSIAVYFIKN